MFIRYNTQYLITIILLLGCEQGYTQTRPIPAAYSSTAGNYIRIWEPTKPTTDQNTVIVNTSLSEARMITQYQDGLGRPLQTVVKEGSMITGGTAVDMVNASEYDALGREQYKYLPFAANSSGSNTSISDGNFKLNPFQQQVSFYNTQLNGQAGETNVGANSSNWAYSQTQYEASPASRVKEAFAPGSSWVGTSSDTSEFNRHSAKVKYLYNTANDDVKVWMVTNGSPIGSFGTYAISAMPYTANKLYKRISTDERGTQVIEFKDKRGLLILKKTQVTAASDIGSGSNHMGWFCTYYVYDDLGNLRCTIPPKAVEKMSTENTWVLSADMLNELCFRYEYDVENRMIMKKVPGAGEIWMVYDRRNRVVMTQDANMRPNGMWNYIKYDVFDRPISTGYLAATSDLAYHTQQAAINDSYPIFNNNFEELTATFYDTYDWLSSNGNPFTRDRYLGDDGSFLTPSNTQPPYAQPLNQNFATTGYVTGTKVKVLGASQYLYSINYYDEKGRVLQTRSVNITGNTTITTNQYSFSGQLLVSYELNACVNGDLTEGIRTSYDYDKLGRQLTVTKYVYTPNGVGNTGEKVIVQNSYDALGQLQIKKLSPGYNGGQGLETLNYEYNIRGWLLGINKGFVKNGGTQKFGFEVAYDKSVPLLSTQNYAPQYNGNISGIMWKSSGDGEARRYDYYYDANNRLIKADFNQYSNSTFNKSAGLDFSVGGNTTTGGNIKYDANGNIAEMWQMGWKVTGSDYIDQLGYEYLNNGNRLKKVADTKTDKNTVLGDFRYSALYEQAVTTNKPSTSVDYTYDANGNLVKDLNKDLGTNGSNGIVYNSLNLPQTITVQGTAASIKGTITYTYDANGNKLQKKVEETIPAAGSTPSYTKTTLTTYMGSVVYEATTPVGGGQLGTDALKYIIHEEGRIRWRPDNKTFVFDYLIKDHLDNVRMVLTEDQLVTPRETLTFEDANISQQNAQWNNKQGQSINVTSVRINVNFGGTMTNAMLVRKSLGSIGATSFIKVMAGDRIHTKVNYYYNIANANNNTTGTLNTIVNSIVNSITNTSTAGALIKGGETAITSQLQGNGDLSSFVNQAPNVNPNDNTQQAPKAYLCVLFFDERFNYDKDNSKIYKVDYLQNNQIGTIDKTFSNAITAGKNGYAYVYFTNESDELVYFDNFYLSHERGPLLEENHYYPFGLSMKAISSGAMAFGEPKNKLQFNGNELQSSEFNDGTGLEMYDFNARNYDAQLGRFMQIDPKSDAGGQESLTAYHFAYNNPTTYNDPGGECPWCVGAVIGGVINVAVHWKQITQGGFKLRDAAVAFGIGAAAGALAVATGGATLAASGISTATLGGAITGGAVAGFAGGGVASIVQGAGNGIYFGDQYSGKQLARDMLIGGITGGIMGGIGYAIKGPPQPAVPKGSRGQNSHVSVEVPQAEYNGVELSDGTYVENFAGHTAGEPMASTDNIFGKEITQTVTRTGRDGKAVEVLFKDGTKIDITTARVKQWVPNLHPNAPAGALQRVSFESFIQGSKGFKRLPTQAELQFLENIFN